MKLDTLIAVRNSKTVYRDGDRCIKVFNAEYTKADVLNEALNQARIEGIGIKTPAILEVTMVDGKWAIVSEFIEGTTLDRLIQQNPDKVDEYMELLVDLQLSINDKKCPGLSRLRDKLTHNIAFSELDATTRYDLHIRLEDMPKHNKVCHGDFNPSNIIIAKDGTPYILDWSHTTQGNASADAAQTYFLFSLGDDPSLASKYLECFCKKSNIPEQNIQKWMPIVAASQSVKSNQQEREYLLSKADA